MMLSLLREKVNSRSLYRVIGVVLDAIFYLSIGPIIDVSGTVVS